MVSDRQIRHFDPSAMTSGLEDEFPPKTGDFQGRSVNL